ncbi:hypothetical protein D0U04_17380 [Bacillus clarus]|uniref:Uncharacterized protein n=1 Tax=Bacillus clarus TaxID=2338372 RepID=A0ABX9KT03_9BACI|nr:hypothetical protein D0U04_17380 [Bacillus clarus]
MDDNLYARKKGDVPCDISFFSPPNNSLVNKIISAILQIYRPQLQIYQRFLKFIGDSTRNIDLQTKIDTTC